MPLDPLIFKKAADATRQSIVQTRGSDSDFIEAKANVVAERIVRSGDAQIQDLTRPRVSNAADIPPMEHSGLVTPGFVLDESQIAAVDMMIQEQYACLMGAAGSGKTTTQRAFLHKMIYGDEALGVEPMEVLKLEGKHSLNIALIAFTGTATHVIKSNMPEWLWPCVKTIHALLEFSPVTTEVVSKEGGIKESTIFMPMRHAANKLDVDIVVIDEASMVGLELWHQLLDALRPGCKVFLIGDLNQLPPVAGHSIFAYALSNWPVAELTKIHRQKEAAANKIVDLAHMVLNGGVEPQFDDPGKDPNWRVIGYELDPLPQKAGAQIVALANQLRTKRIHVSVDPEESLIYDPYRDRIITAGNGYDENDPIASVEQSVINEALSQLIEPPSEDHPRYIIDAGMSRKKFAVGHRVMATKNEPPDVVDRVTNGMVGRITAIEKHPGWLGNHSMVGPEHLVKIAQKEQLDIFLKKQQMSQEDRVRAEYEDLEAQFDKIDVSGISNAEMAREGGGASSHKVTVQFANGATRIFASKAGVDSLMLAYASTCHKCQGAQFDTAIIVVHHSAKRMLSREWLYTAVTRAQKRVILLYTKYGVRSAVSKQKIFGRTLQEKIQRYQQLADEAAGPLAKKVHVQLRIEE